MVLRARIEHHTIRPGKPVENAFAESFNSRVREDLLNQHCFTSVRHAQDLIDDWLADYNQVRPHTALGGFRRRRFSQLRPGPMGPGLSRHPPQLRHFNPLSADAERRRDPRSPWPQVGGPRNQDSAVVQPKGRRF